MATYQIGDASRVLIREALQEYAARRRQIAASIDGDDKPETVESALALAERAESLSVEFAPDA